MESLVCVLGMHENSVRRSVMHGWTPRDDGCRERGTHAAATVVTAAGDWQLLCACNIMMRKQDKESYVMQQAILNVQCVQLPQLWHVIMHMMYNWGFHVTCLSCLSKVGMSWIAYVARGSHLDQRARISAWPTWLHPPCGCEPPATRVNVCRNWQDYLACHLAQCHCLREVARASCDDGVTNTTLRRLLALWDDAVVHAQDVARAVPPWHASRGLGEPRVDLYHEVLTSKAIVEYSCDRA